MDFYKISEPRRIQAIIKNFKQYIMIKKLMNVYINGKVSMQPSSG